MAQTTSQPNAAATCTERVLPASPQRVFAAFEQPHELARWWGPDGFRNTFEVFEFVPDGRWVFGMHGPNGTDFQNECMFEEIVPDSRIVIRHVSQPHFTLTVSLTPEGDGTRLRWTQEFESEQVLQRLLAIVGPANEQNLDRLGAVLAGGA